MLSTGAKNLSSTSSAAGSVSNHSIREHFNELQGEIDNFLVSFNDWIVEKKRMLSEDKQQFQKALTDEHDLVEALKKQYAQLQIKRQQVTKGIFVQSYLLI